MRYLDHPIPTLHHRLIPPSLLSKHDDDTPPVLEYYVSFFLHDAENLLTEEGLSILYRDVLELAPTIRIKLWQEFPCHPLRRIRLSAATIYYSRLHHDFTICRAKWHYREDKNVCAQPLSHRISERRKNFFCHFPGSVHSTVSVPFNTNWEYQAYCSRSSAEPVKVAFFFHSPSALSFSASVSFMTLSLTSGGSFSQLLLRCSFHIRIRSRGLREPLTDSQRRSNSGFSLDLYLSE